MTSPRATRSGLLVCALVRRDGDVLMVREDHGDGPVWVLPGGQVDPGELVHQAVVRELREETGLEAYGTGGARLWLWPDGTDGDPLILPAPGPR